MPTDKLPPMKPLAPIVDQLKEIARQEIPAPRTCLVHLYDDYTFRIRIEHRYGDDEIEGIVYAHDSENVYWRDTAGAERVKIDDPDHEGTIITTRFAEDAERVVATIPPPFE